jgi:long-chain acyl-CoA synthetase
MMIEHPKIKDLVIVGIPDDLKGEAPKAFIQLIEGEKATAEEIREYCKARMAPYKVPIAVAFLREIPRSAAGKALRRELRDREWEKHTQ